MADPTEHLYGLALEEFIPARDATAREVRRGGDRETAAQIAKLPKPTPAAWTANQVAREQPELIEAMLDAGAGLRAAQESAVAGHGAVGLREATVAERAAVDAVMTAAVAHRPAGRPLSRAMADRLRTTLHAAAGDEAIRAALAAGRLVSEAQAGGAWPFALEAASRAGKPRRAKPRAKPKPKPRAKDDDDSGGPRGGGRRNGRRRSGRSARRPRHARRSRPSCGRRGALRVRARVATGPRRTARERLTAAARGRQRRNSRSAGGGGDVGAGPGGGVGGAGGGAGRRSRGWRSGSTRLGDPLARRRGPHGSSWGHETGVTAGTEEAGLDRARHIRDLARRDTATGS